MIITYGHIGDTYATWNTKRRGKYRKRNMFNVTRSWPRRVEDAVVTKARGLTWESNIRINLISKLISFFYIY